MQRPTLVAGRNPANRRWPDHNPHILYIESGAWAHLDAAPAIVPPLTLAALAASKESR